MFLSFLLLLHDGWNDTEEEVDKSEAQRAEGHHITAESESFSLGDCSSDDGRKAVAKTIGHIVQAWGFVTQEWRLLNSFFLANSWNDLR